MKYLRTAIALSLSCLVSCSAPAPADDSTLALARELEAAERQGFEPPARLNAEVREPRADPRLVPLRPTGPELTADYSVRSSADEGAVRFEMQRGATRLRVRGAGQEWFFERNPLAAEQVTGFKVDPGRKRLIEYPHTDLEIDGYARGWSSLARLGVDPESLTGMRRSGEYEAAFGLRFERLVARESDGQGWREVLWSDEHQLPLRAVDFQGMTVALLEVQTSPATVGPQRATEAYPDFAVQDVADWREALHDHGAEAHQDIHEH